MTVFTLTATMCQAASAIEARPVDGFAGINVIDYLITLETESGSTMTENSGV